MCEPQCCVLDSQIREAVGVLCIIANFAVKKLQHTTLLMNFSEHFCIYFKSFVIYFNKSSYTTILLQVLPYVSYIYDNHFHAFFT